MAARWREDQLRLQCGQEILQEITSTDSSYSIAAMSLERAQEFARRSNIPRASGSYEELANDPEIDTVYLGVLHTKHSCVSLLFLKEGERVLCGKTLNSTQSELPDRARGEATWSRCFPVHAEVRRLLEEEAVGPNSLLGGEGAGWWRPLDIGVCADGGQQREARVHPGHRGSAGVRHVMVFCTFSIAVPLPNDATISGTKGTIDAITSPLWGSQGEPTDASGRLYLADGLTEIMDDARTQVVVVFSQGSQ
ncbi:trans-1,2-dihydrobenzene-1,2-diol dehydrogenase-like [Diretmus argenteus]